MNFYMISKILNIFAINNIPSLISFNVRVLSTSSPPYIFFSSSTTSSSRNIFYTESDVLISSIQMGSAIWYKKRNDGGTKEREKLRKRNDGEGTLRRWNKKENHPRRKKKKKWENEIDSADNSRLHHWFSSFVIYPYIE